MKDDTLYQSGPVGQGGDTPIDIKKKKKQISETTDSLMKENAAKALDVESGPLMSNLKAQYQMLKAPIIQKYKEAKIKYSDFKDDLAYIKSSPEEKEKLNKRERFKTFAKGMIESQYQHIFVKDKKGTWQHFKSIRVLTEDGIPIVKGESEVKDIESRLKGNYSEYKISKGNIADILKQLRHDDSLVRTYATDRADKWKKNLQASKEQIEKNIPGMAKDFATEIGATRISEEGIPRMAISAFGSTNPPTDIKPQDRPVPAYGQQYQRPRRKTTRPVSHETYQAWKDAGYSEEELTAQGYVDKRSTRYQEQSVFGRGVIPYRPISRLQSTLFLPDESEDMTRSEFQRRLDRGETYQAYRVPILSPGVIGRDTGVFKPKVFGGPDEFGNKPGPFRIPVFNPMSANYQTDAQGNLIVKKKFFTPPLAKL